MTSAACCSAGKALSARALWRTQAYEMKSLLSATLRSTADEWLACAGDPGGRLQRHDPRV